MNERVRSVNFLKVFLEVDLELSSLPNLNEWSQYLFIIEPTKLSIKHFEQKPQIKLIRSINHYQSIVYMNRVRYRLTTGHIIPLFVIDTDYNLLYGVNDKQVIFRCEYNVLG